VGRAVAEHEYRSVAAQQRHAADGAERRG
jgi:hypothetical protein